MSISPIKSFAELDAADIFALPVHPAAEVFPMLPEDEMDNLVEDIKTYGLLFPLVVGKDDTGYALIDGRNRREACRRADAAPTVKLLEKGQDPIAYVIAMNINRRHLTKSQRAMAVAMIYPEPEERGRGRKSVVTTDFSRGHLSHARTVLRHTPDAAPLVLSGAMSLDTAYKHAQDLKQAAEGEEVGMRRLRAEHPDLADQVEEGTLTLKEAWAVERERAEQIKHNKHAFAGSMYHMQDVAHHVANDVQIEATVRFILNDAFIYEEYAKRPISGLIEAMEELEAGMPKLMKRLREAQRHARKD